MSLAKENNGNEKSGSHDAWKQWSLESKALAGEHIYLKMKALKDYRLSGFISYGNLRRYASTIVELDKHYSKAHLDAWDKLTRAIKVEYLHREVRLESNGLSSENRLSFEG